MSVERRHARGELELGHVLQPTGLDLDAMIAIRHTFKDDGITGPQDVTEEKVRAYTERQGFRKFPATPPPFWLVFVTDGGLRSRLYGVYENLGIRRTTEQHRFFDLRPSDVLSALNGRLVIEWSRDAINWSKSGRQAQSFRVLEIADPAEVLFPGFDKVIIDFAELTEVVSSSRYRSWQDSLAAVQGIYLITDSRTGRHYVGKADGAERILGRWSTYARTGHGGNVALADLVGVDPQHVKDFRFSILRVFGPDTPKADVDAAEAHYKTALMTRTFGYNRN